MIPGTSWLDWKLGGRMLVKYPGLSVIGGLTLALAIGLGAAWFEVTQQLLNPRLPLPDGDRIVQIDNWDAAQSRPESRSAYDFELWREQLTSINELSAYRSTERNLITPDGNVQPTPVAEMTASAFALTRVTPLIGRAFMAVDADPGSPRVALIGHDLWQTGFNGERDIIGSTVTLGRASVTIIGVMPAGFRFPVNHQLWVPMRVESAAPRTGMGMRMFGRLAEGATLESAQAELKTIGQRIATMNPATHAQLSPRVSPYAGSISDRAQVTGLLRLSNIFAWLILAAASANVATLMFARNATRESEIVVRNALGAARGRILMQLFVEAFVLAAVAAVVGLGLAAFLLKFGIPLWADPNRLPFWYRFSIQPLTVVYAAVLALGGAVLIGLLPALKATGARVQSAVARMSGDTASMQFGGLWSVMIVLQVTFAALCLPIALGTAFDTLRAYNARPSFPTYEYLTFRPALDRDPAGSAPPGMRRVDYSAAVANAYEELKRRLESEPSVAAVSFADGMPGMSHPIHFVEAQRGSDAPFLVDTSIDGDRAWSASVDIGFFDAMQVPMVAGRAFHGGDAAAKNAVIINETLARNIGGNPVGVRVRFTGSSEGQPNPWYDVVGVVRDDAMRVSEGSASDFVFLPVSAADVSPLVVGIHVRDSAAAFAARVQTIATQVDPALLLYDVLPLDEVIRRRNQPGLQGTIAILSIALLMTALSAAGLYSLMSVAVTRRTREIGIRMAIGATPRAVLTTLFARAAMQVGIGILLGNVLLPPLMTALGQSNVTLGEVLPVMVFASAGMLLTGLIACGVPARRALRIDPTEAVRYAG